MITENQSLNGSPVQEKRIGLKLEYIYDNTHDAALNIKNGTRYKIYTEFINRFNLQVIDGFEIIDSIADVKTDQNDRPVSDVKILKINIIK